MSYIQVEMGGKLKGMKFNKYAEDILRKKVQPDNLLSGIYSLVYSGLVANCFVKQIAQDFTFEEVCDWVDQLSDEVLLQIHTAFRESDSYKKGQALIDEQAAKEEAASKITSNGTKAVKKAKPTASA